MHYDQSKQKYQGVFIAAPTPMHEDETLDLPRLRALIRYYCEAGLGVGNCVCTILGAGGEAMHLDENERRQVAETAVEEADGKIPIFIGVGHTRTRTAVELARHAEKIGADGLQVELPYYFAATPDDAFAFVSEVAEAVECGIGLYPTPWASGLQFERSFIERICDALPNVVGLKWSHASVHHWFEVIAEFGERLSIVQNMGPMMAPSAFVHGARGYVSQPVSAAPRQNAQIIQWLQAGQYDKALPWLRIVEESYYKLLFEGFEAGYRGEGNFIKTAMDSVGFPCGPARLPNRRLSEPLCQKYAEWAKRIHELVSQP
jgi:dihydrodipicolinate synthase/N-acetylneuraminate lyase